MRRGRVDASELAHSYVGGEPEANDDDDRTPTGNVNQGGPSEIKVMITNHCTNCDEVPGHFDINDAPAGWDNPKIYYKQLDPSACQ